MTLGREIECLPFKFQVKVLEFLEVLVSANLKLTDVNKELKIRY